MNRPVATGVGVVVVLVMGVAAYSLGGKPADPGCLGACSNMKTAVDGWCGNCPDHCVGGTEAECTAGCGEPWDEGPCLKQADANVRQCYANCNGNKNCEGNCGGDYKRDQIQACHTTKAAEDDKRAGCLAKCGGIKGCRNSWCDGNHPERDRCYADSQTAYAECQRRCGGDVPQGCKNESCVGFLMVADCASGRRVTGACLGFSWKF